MEIELKTDKTLDSINPSNVKEVIGTISQASVEQANLAMEVALKRFETWKKVDPKVRADIFI